MEDKNFNIEQGAVRAFINAQIPMLTDNSFAKKTMLINLIKNHMTDNRHEPPFSFTVSSVDGKDKHDLKIDKNAVVSPDDYLDSLRTVIQKDKDSPYFKMQISIGDFVHFYASALATDKIGRVNSVLEKQYLKSFNEGLKKSNISSTQLLTMDFPLYSIKAFPVLNDAKSISEKMLNDFFKGHIAVSEPAHKMILKLDTMREVKDFLDRDYFSQDAVQKVFGVCHSSIVKDCYTSLGQQEMLRQIDNANPIKRDVTTRFAPLYNSSRIAGAQDFVAPYKFDVSKVEFVVADHAKINLDRFGTKGLIVGPEDSPRYANVEVNFKSNPSHSIAGMEEGTINAKIAANNIDNYLIAMLDIVKDPKLSFNEKETQISALEGRFQDIGAMAFANQKKRELFQDEFDSFVSANIDEFVGEQGKISDSFDIVMAAQGEFGEQDVMVYQKKGHESSYFVTDGVNGVVASNAADTMALLRMVKVKNFSNEELRQLTAVMSQDSKRKDEVFYDFVQKICRTNIEKMVESNPALLKHKDYLTQEISSTLAKVYAKVEDREFDAYVMNKINSVLAQPDVVNEVYNNNNITIKAVSNSLLHNNSAEMTKPFGYSVELPSKDLLYFSASSPESLQKIIEVAKVFDHSNSKSSFLEDIAKNYGPQEVMNLDGVKTVIAMDNAISSYGDYVENHPSLRKKFEERAQTVCDRFTSSGLEKELLAADSIEAVSLAVQDYIKVLPVNSAPISYLGKDHNPTGGKTFFPDNCYQISLPNGKDIVFSQNESGIKPLGVIPTGNILEFKLDLLDRDCVNPNNPNEKLSDSVAMHNKVLGVINSGIDFKLFSEEFSKPLPSYEIPKDFDDSIAPVVTGIAENFSQLDDGPSFG